MNHFELPPYSKARFMAARQVESLPDPLGDGHVPGARQTLNLRGKVVSPETWQYAQYVLVFTTLSSASATARQVLECYRLRWQVELTFKRLKSIAQLGHVPKHDDQSTRAWLYGKLFVALLSQKLARVGRTISPWGYSLPETENPQPVA
jgi:hypothetical protein